MGITTGPTLRSLEYEKIVAHSSLPTNKLILRKRMYLRPYFDNELGVFHNARGTIADELPYSVKTVNYWNLLHMLIVLFNTKESSISKQKTNDKYNLKAGNAYRLTKYPQHKILFTH